MMAHPWRLLYLIVIVIGMVLSLYAWNSYLDAKSGEVHDFEARYGPATVAAIETYNVMLREHRAGTAALRSLQASRPYLGERCRKCGKKAP